MRTRYLLALAGIAVALTLAACGGSSGGSSSASKSANPNAPEVSPAGDIPDNQAFVRYTPPGAGYSVEVPEGWSRTSTAGTVVFTDKLNAIRLESAPAHAALTVGEATRTEVPRLAHAVRGFQRQAVSAVARKAGTAVRITYLADAKANPVTARRASTRSSATSSSTRAVRRFSP